MFAQKITLEIEGWRVTHKLAKRFTMPARKTPALQPPLELLTDVHHLIKTARNQTVMAVNAELSLLYWNIGTRINQEVLQHSRAEYGKQIVKHLATDLSLEFGSGWSVAQLRHCLQFAKVFTNLEIVSALRRPLSWTKIKTLIYIKDDLKRTFYQEMAQLERWSSRQLQERIASQLFERSALSQQPEQTIRHDLEQLHQTGQVAPEMLFKDPYILDYLGLKILCTGKKQEQIELLELGKSRIHVAEYLTQLPPRDVLIAKLAQSLEAAQECLGHSQ